MRDFLILALIPACALIGFMVFKRKGREPWLAAVICGLAAAIVPLFGLIALFVVIVIPERKPTYPVEPPLVEDNGPFGVSPPADQAFAVPSPSPAPADPQATAQPYAPPQPPSAA